MFKEERNTCIAPVAMETESQAHQGRSPTGLSPASAWEKFELYSMEQRDTLIGTKYDEMETTFSATKYTKAYPQHTPPEPPAVFALSKLRDPNGFVKATHMEAVKAHLKVTHKLAENKPKVYNYIKLHMTPESWEEVRAHNYWNVVTSNDAAGAEVTETVEQLREPYYLIRAIKITHSEHRTGMSALDNEEAMTGYQNIKQNPEESLHKYLEYFNQEVNILKALGLAVPTEKQQAVKFIRGLDECFDNLSAIQLKTSQ
jgi:hypothetical protein